MNKICPKRHRKVVGNMNHPKDEDITKEDCDGKLYFEEVLEGCVCTKCQYYDGVK